MLLAREDPEVGPSEAVKLASALFRLSLAGPCPDADGPHGSAARGSNPTIHRRPHGRGHMDYTHTGSAKLLLVATRLR